MLGGSLLRLGERVLIHGERVLDPREVHNRQNQEVPHTHNRRDKRAAHHEQGNPHGEKHHDARARRNAPAPQAEC